MNSRMRSYRDSSLFRNTLWMFSGNGVKLIIQAVYFVIIARSLEPEQYGAFVAVVALAAIFSPFVGMGMSNLIVRNVSLDRESFPASWGNGLLSHAITGLAGLLLICACRFVLPHSLSWAVLVPVALADLLFGRLSDYCTFAYSAVGNFSATAQINVWISLSRLLGLSLLASINRHPTVRAWAVVYLASTAVTAIAVVGFALRSLGRPSLDIRRLRAEIGEGFFYSVGLSAQTLYNDIDKTMLASYGQLAAAGIYGAAYRLIDVSLAPIRSLLSAAYPGFFKAGNDGVAASLLYMKRLLPKAVGYAVVICLVLLVAAPVVPHILGKDYARTVEALRWLAVLPVLKSVHFFLADALTGAGYQRIRTGVQAVVAIVNVLVNLWLIPAYSWRGAAWSSIGSDALLAAFLFFVAMRLRSTQERGSALQEEVA